MPGAEPRGAVLDASVAVKWLVSEPASADAARLIDQAIVWYAPRLLLTECAGALHRKAVAGQIDAVAAIGALRSLLDSIKDRVIQLADDELVVESGLALAFALSHRAADCMYLALAETEGLPLATADFKLATLARRRGIEVLGVGAAA